MIIYIQEIFSGSLKAVYKNRPLSSKFVSGFFLVYTVNNIFNANTPTDFSESILSLHKKLSFPLRISAENADLVTFTEEILDEKLHFLGSVSVLLNLWPLKS